MAAALFWTGSDRPGGGSTVIGSQPELQAALADAQPGAVLLLAGGDYGKVVIGRIDGGAAGITLKSADAGARAVFTGLVVKDAKGLVLDGLRFDYSFTPGDNGPATKGMNWPFQVLGSANVTIRNSLFDGDIATVGRQPEVGLPTGTGIVVRHTRGIVLERNEITGFQRGLAIDNSSDVVIRGNDIHRVRMDAMNLAALTTALIEGNHLHDFNRSLATGDHSDMIQFWTAGTKVPSTDITIRGNLLNSGSGLYTQSIFMRNEVVDQKQAGEEMFYRNLLIEQNVIINAHLHGITVGEADGLVVRNNTLIHNALSNGPEKNPPLWIPQITMAKRSVNVTITNNISFPMQVAKLPRSWEISGNLWVQDGNPSGPGWYDKVFAGARGGDPANLANFAYLPAGPAGGGDVGAEGLQADRVDAFMRRFGEVMPLSAPGTPKVETVAAAPMPKVLKAPEPAAVAPRPAVREKPLAEARAPVRQAEVLRFDAKTGTMLVQGAGGQQAATGLPLVTLPEGGQAIAIGPGSAPLALPPEAMAGFFGAAGFELSVRFRTASGADVAGELLRIHQALVLSLTPNGSIEAQSFQPGKPKPVAMRTGPLRLHDGQWHTVTVRHDPVARKFSVLVDGAIRAVAPADAPVGPMQAWGLSFGNGFGQKSFEGQISALQLNSK